MLHGPCTQKWGRYSLAASRRSVTTRSTPTSPLLTSLVAKKPAAAPRRRRRSGRSHAVVVEGGVTLRRRIVGTQINHGLIGRSRVFPIVARRGLCRPRLSPVSPSPAPSSPPTLVVTLSPPSLPKSKSDSKGHPNRKIGILISLNQIQILLE